MKTKILLLASVFLCALLTIAHAQSDRAKEVEVDLEKLANSLVSQCANIHEGDFVFVNGGIRDMELLENIVVHIRKKGAFPMLTINSDRMTRKIFTEVPEKFDSQFSYLNYNLVKMMDAQITISSGETPDLLADIPPERFATRSKANKPIADLYQKRNIKSVNLGNGLYPTKAKATQFNITFDELTELFWAGIEVDYSVLVENGSKLKSILNSGQELQIFNTNGTSFKVQITNRPAFISDGIISEDDIKNGTAGTSVYLPAGEVYTSVVKGTANGKIVVEDFFFMGQNITGIELEFTNGVLTAMDAKTGLKQLKAYYDAQEKGIEEFSLVDFGINPNIEIPSGSKLLSFVPAGMVTVGIGNNIWAGGDNNSSSGLNFFLPDCTVKIDGQPVILEGKLNLK